jgi:hypothetical protein
VLQRDVLVPTLAGDVEGEGEGDLQLAGSMVAVALVSAISRVYTPATPFPPWCTVNMMRVASTRERRKTAISTSRTNSIVV